jgi:phage terminase large subunit
VVVQANHQDNPFFPEELEAERLLDEQGDEARYRHIWLGDYEELSDSQLISGKLVEQAMKRKPEVFPHDEMIMGVDVARYGKDETVIAFRRGRDAYTDPWLTFSKLDTMETAARVAAEFDRISPDALFVDETGVGAGVVDRLNQLGYPVQAINFGSKPDGLVDAKVANKRAEMWVRMREWLRGGAIPDDPRLEAELTSVEYKHDANNALILEKKEDMAKRGLPSPDRADALALTFAYPVHRELPDWDDPDIGRDETTGY